MPPDPKPPPHKKRKPPGQDKKYLAWIREQPCARCGQVAPSEPAHQRCLGNCGVGIKPPDRDALPLCRGCHSLEHSMGGPWLWGETEKEKAREKVRALCREYLKRYEEGL